MTRPGRALVLGAGIVAALTAIKLGLPDALGYPTPFRLFFIASLTAAWYGGTFAGIAVTLLAALVGNVLFLGRADGLELSVQGLTSTVAFLTEGTAICVITSRLQAARRRNTQQLDKLTAVFANVGAGITVQDPAGRLVYANDLAARMSGFATGAEMLATPIAQLLEKYELTREDGSPLSYEELPGRRLIRDGTADEMVVRFKVLATGEEHYAVLRADAIRDEHGKLELIVNVFRDASAERRRDAQRVFLVSATAELNSSLDYEKTLATVARLAVPAIADWCAVDMRDGDATRRLAVAHIDPAKIELVRQIQRRYPPAPQAAAGVPNILRTGVAEMVADITPAMIAAAARDPEHRVLIDQLVLCSYIGVPIKLGDQTSGVISLAMAESNRHYDAADLAFATVLGERAAVAIANAASYREAERLRAEAAAQRDRLHAMIMAAPTAICVLRRDPDLRFELMNPLYRARLAAALDDGTPVAAVALDATNVAMLERVFETGEPAIGHEQPVHATYTDGLPTHYLSYKVQPLRDAAGRVDRVVVFANDVTDQVLARHRLEAARSEAEHANRSKDEFLAMLGHELRNPLAPILTALELMELRAAGALERERKVIDRQVKHVVRLVDDLLDVSRITRGRVELAREVVDVGDAIARALEMAAPLLYERKHRLVKDIEPGLLVDGDLLRLAQVIGNIVQNSAKYTEPGGSIAIHAAREAGQVVVRVRDDGIGIAPEMLPRVFELFVQERQALDRSRGGLGIGLAIVRSLVTQHGGTVEATSAGLGKGSELIVRLPAASGELRAAGATEAGRSRDGNRGRILVVDDNADALELLAASLEHLGYHTLRASDGPSALALAAREHPDIALLDIGLPLMDGFEVARRLRATPDLAAMRLVALTGYGQSSDREKSAAAGFDAHLVKPVTIEAVQNTLERLKT